MGISSTSISRMTNRASIPADTINFEAMAPIVMLLSAAEVAATLPSSAPFRENCATKALYDDMDLIAAAAILSFSSVFSKASNVNGSGLHTTVAQYISLRISPSSEKSMWRKLRPVICSHRMMASMVSRVFIFIRI